MHASKASPLPHAVSASSSLVAHCLGITSPDPVRLNLYFERFLNPARHSPPDIDTDLCSNRRDEVLHFVYRRFGPDRVAMVATINRFRARSALREVAKAHGLSPNEVNELARELPYRWYGPPPRPQTRRHLQSLKSAIPTSIARKYFAMPQRSSSCHTTSRSIPAEWSLPLEQSPTWHRPCWRLKVCVLPNLTWIRSSASDWSKSTC